jgi:hypothetical protein
MSQRHIKVSELRSFAFCERAWHLEREGMPSTLEKKPARGELDHHEHGRAAVESRTISRIAGILVASLEDETGIANVILRPDVFQRLRVTVLNNSYLIVDGILQNQRGVVSVKATDVRPCIMSTMAVAASHDF